MLDNLQGSNNPTEQELVQKLQQAREPAEPAQTEEAEAVEDPTETEIDEPTGETEETEVEESEESTEEEAGEVDLYTIVSDGEEEQLDWDEIVKRAKMGKNFYRKTEDLANERKAFEAERTQAKQLVQDEIQKYQASTQKLEELISKQEGAIDWTELRDTDPSEYLRQKELQEERLQALAKAKEDQQLLAQQQREQTVTQESQKLLQVMGDAWKDPEVRNKELKQAYEYVYSRGVTEQEASNLLDHRFWLMVMDAAKYQALQEVGDVVKKEVKKAPKTVKPTKAKSKRVVQELDDKRSALRKSGKEKDAVALLKAKRLNR